MWQIAKLFFFLECKIKLGPTEGTNILTMYVVHVCVIHIVHVGRIHLIDGK